VHGLLVVGGRATTGRIHEAHIILRGKITFPGCPQIPAQGFAVILRHSQAPEIHSAEIVLRREIAQVRSFPVPLHGFRIVLLRARTGFKRQACLKLGCAIARFRFAQNFDHMTGSLGRPLKNNFYFAGW